MVPATQADLDKMSTSLARIVEDDPSLRFTRNPETSESLLTGLGEVQIEVALDRISRKFGANLNVKLPVVPYRETITQITNSEPPQETDRWQRAVRTRAATHRAQNPRRGV